MKGKGFMLKIFCNSDCKYTSLEEGECQKPEQKDFVLMMWTEHEINGKKFPCVICDDYEPIK